jgi:hypothetical protein
MASVGAAMKGDDEATIRANGCAAALRALDAYEAEVYPMDQRDRLYGREKPADLQRMRDKLRGNAYASQWHWLDDLRCLFNYFGDSLPESVQGRMAAHHFYWVRALWRLEQFGPVADYEAKVAQWRSGIKELELEFFADQEARKVAAARTSSSSAAPAAAAASSSNASLPKQQPEVTSSSVPAPSTAAATAASSASQLMSARSAGAVASAASAIAAAAAAAGSSSPGAAMDTNMFATLTGPNCVAAARSALAAFDAGVNSRVRANFEDSRANLRKTRDEPMGLERMREKEITRKERFGSRMQSAFSAVTTQIQRHLCTGA